MDFILLVIIAPLTLTNSVEKLSQIVNGVHELAAEMGKAGAEFPPKRNAFACLPHVLFVFGAAVVMAEFTLVFNG